MNSIVLMRYVFLLVAIARALYMAGVYNIVASMKLYT